MQNDTFQGTTIGTNGNGLPQTRNRFSIYFVILKKLIAEVVANASKVHVFKVNLQNDRGGQYTKQLVGELQKSQTLLDKISKISIPNTTPEIAAILHGSVREITNSLDNLKTELLKIRENQGITFPEIQQVQGTVTVDALPPDKNMPEMMMHMKEMNKKLENLSIVSLPESTQLASLLDEIKGLSTKVGNIKLEVPAPKDKPIKFPEFPKQITINEGQDIIDLLSGLKQAIDDLPGKLPKMEEFPTKISVDNFPPQRWPLPVTNVNINSLRGPVLTTSMNVGSTATLTPAAPLENRRALIIYNNSSQTVYIGGADVTTLNGFPIPANQFSASLDIGDRVSLYAIVSSSTSNIRIFEASMDAIGS